MTKQSQDMLGWMNCKKLVIHKMYEIGHAQQAKYRCSGMDEMYKVGNW